MEKLLKSRYRIGEKIGESPFSVTYFGTYLEKEDPLVIKIYKRSVLSSPLIKTVKKKVRTLCNLDHKNIGKVIDGDYGWQGFYFVREFVEGKTLAEILSPDNKLSLEKALDFSDQICQALETAHEKGIIHGALSPSNVIITNDNQVKLTDFVLIGEMRESLKERAEMVFLSTPFLSPEEVRGDTISYPADVYGVGLLIYYMLTGTNPFAGKDGINTTLNILRKVPEALGTKKIGVPEYLEEIVCKCLEKDPAMRFRLVKNLHSSIKTKMVIDETPTFEEFSDISFDGLIGSLDEGYEPEPEHKEEVRKRSAPKFVLAALIVIAAALLGISYAVYSGLLNK